MEIKIDQIKDKRKGEYIVGNQLEIEALSLDVCGIMEYLRNRYPFLMVDYAPKVIPGKMAIAYKNLTINEGYFVGHFPGNPIMPGVLQLEAIYQTAALAIHTLPENKEKTSFISRTDKVIFHEHLRPGDVLRIETEVGGYKRGVAKGKGKIISNEKLIVEAEFVLVIPEDMVKLKKEENI